MTYHNIGVLHFTISLTRELYYFNDIRHYDSKNVRICLGELQCVKKNLDYKAKHPVSFNAAQGRTSRKHWAHVLPHWGWGGPRIEGKKRKEEKEKRKRKKKRIGEERWTTIWNEKLASKRNKHGIGSHFEQKKNPMGDGG